MMKRFILQEIKGQVVILTLNRPERHNSLVPDLLQELYDSLQAVTAKSDIRAVVLQANGRSFSTGGDARGFVEHLATIENYSKHIVGLLNQVILTLLDLPVPVVAAVQGTVTGGSIGLILASDIVLLSPEASFRPYYSVVGPSPDGGWTAMLPSLIGRKRAAEVLMLNRLIDAEQAVALGLANRIIPSEELRAEALRWARGISDKKPGSIRHTKGLLNLDRPKVARRLQAELDHFLEQIQTEEAQKGFQDFLAQLKASKPSQEAVR